MATEISANSRLFLIAELELIIYDFSPYHGVLELEKIGNYFLSYI